MTNDHTPSTTQTFTVSEFDGETCMGELTKLLDTYCKNDYCIKSQQLHPSNETRDVTIQGGANGLTLVKLSWESFPEH